MIDSSARRPSSDADPTRSVASSRAKRKHTPLVQHSNATPDWGSTLLMRAFAGRVLGVVNGLDGRVIDLDYASSPYWQAVWSEDDRPSAFLDGSPGRDVLVDDDRRDALCLRRNATAFFNPPGLDGGRMVAKCWTIFDRDHRVRLIDSGVYVGFNSATLQSLQNVDAPDDRHPLSPDFTTILPARRPRYLCHPEAAIAALLKRQGRCDRRRLRSLKAWNAFERQLDVLRNRKNDLPVVGDAPPCGSFMTVLWAHNGTTRRRQMSAARRFLAEESAIDGSLFQRVAVLGQAIS